MSEQTPAISKKVKPWIWVVSILVPVLVSVIENPNFTYKIELGFNTFILPAINAGINSIVSILLLVGLILIRQRKIELHRKVMIAAFCFSALFLVSYVLFHISSPRTLFCEDSPVSKGVYYFVLFSHIALSVSIVPLASFSIFHALRVDYEKHKRLVKFTWPLWFYVSVTGVLVYFLISPCYPA
jgi:putative membrane protein